MSITGSYDRDGQGPQRGEPVGQLGESLGVYHGEGDGGQERGQDDPSFVEELIDAMLNPIESVLHPIETLKEIFDIESGDFSRIGGRLTGELQGGFADAKRSLGLFDHQTAERERLQGEYAGRPGYGDFERNLYDEAASRVSAAGATGTRAYDITNDVFRDARDALHGGASFDEAFSGIQGGSRPDSDGSSGTATFDIRPASYTNRAPSIPQSEGGREAQTLQRAVINFNTGRPLTAAQRRALEGLPRDQQRLAGYFVTPGGEVKTAAELAARAIGNLLAGQPLSPNQEIVVGQAFLRMTPGERQRIGNQLTRAAPNRQAAIRQINRAVRAARDTQQAVRREARAQQQRQALKAAGVRKPRQALARLEAAGGRKDAASKLAALKAAGVTRPVSQVERLAAQGVRNPVQRLLAQADRRDKAAATAAGTTVNKLRALRAAGVQQPAAKLIQLKAAGVRRPVQKLAELKHAGVKRAAEKLVQLESAGVQRPAQKNAELRRAGIERGVQKVAQLKAAGVKRPVAKLAQLQQAGVKRPAQQLVQLKQAGVQRPAQKLLAQQAAAQRGALGKQTQEIIRTTDQSLTFKTAGGQMRSAAQVAAGAAKNLAAGRPLTPNQKRLLASAR